MFHADTYTTQGGLSAILGPNPSPSQIEDLTIRAQCFYLSRKKKIPIDFDAYKTYLQSKSKPHVSSTSPEQQHPIFPLDSTPSSSNPTTTTQTLASASASTSSNHPTHESDLPPVSSTTSIADPGNSTAPQPTQTNNNQAPYPPTFAQIIELITSGAPIPGIIDVPDIVRPELASVSKLPKRRKPWEKDVPEEVIQATTGEGLFGDERDRYIAQELPEEEGEKKEDETKDKEKSEEEKRE